MTTSLMPRLGVDIQARDDGAVTPGRAYPRSWYLICRSREVARGGVTSRSLLGHPIVLVRTQAGLLRALSAHCAHMGTHLGGGSVVGECLRCPMHGWTYDLAGHCLNAPDSALRTWPVQEKFGSVFLFYGQEPLFPLPSFETAAESELRTDSGRPVTINCPWIAIPANAYDMEHLSAVHERALRQPPTVEQLDAYRLRLRYLSRVTGHGLADRVMKWLARDRIQVTITCWGGTLFTVESQIGRHRGTLLLGILPTDAGVQVTPVFGVRKSSLPGLDWLWVNIAGWLFTRFLEKDVAIMEGMRFKAPASGSAEQEPLQQFLAYVDRLPAGPGGFQAQARK